MIAAGFLFDAPFTAVMAGGVFLLELGAHT